MCTSPTLPTSLAATQGRFSSRLTVAPQHPSSQ